MLFVLIESATNGLCKTGLSLKIDKAVPKLWLICQTPPKQCLWENSVFLYGASNYRTFGAQIANCACAIRILEDLFEQKKFLRLLGHSISYKQCIILFLFSRNVIAWI